MTGKITPPLKYHGGKHYFAPHLQVGITMTDDTKTIIASNGRAICVPADATDDDLHRLMTMFLESKRVGTTDYVIHPHGNFKPECHAFLIEGEWQLAFTRDGAWRPDPYPMNNIVENGNTKITIILEFEDPYEVDVLLNALQDMRDCDVADEDDEEILDNIITSINNQKEGAK